MKSNKKRIVTARMGKQMYYKKKKDSSHDKNAETKDEYSITREWMKYVITPFTWGIIIVCGIAGILCLVKCFSLFILAISPTGIINIIDMAKGFALFIIGLFLITVSVVTYFADKELQEEKDKQFVATVFSSFVTFMALLVAMFALLKDVII